MKKFIIHGTVFFLIAQALLFRTNSLPGYFFRAYLGNVDAMNEVSSYYYSKEKYDIAEKWSAKSAEKGSVEGYRFYALLTAQRGEKEKSVEILKKGVENGCIRCGYYLSRGFAYGRLMEDILDEEMVISPEESAKWAIKTSLIATNDENDKELIENSLYTCVYINFLKGRDHYLNVRKCIEKFEQIHDYEKKIRGFQLNEIRYISAITTLYGGNGIKPDIEKGSKYFINWSESATINNHTDYFTFVETIKIFYNGKGVEKNVEKAKSLIKNTNLIKTLNFPTKKNYELYQCFNNHAFSKGLEIVEVRKENNKIYSILRDGKTFNILKKLSVSAENWNNLKKEVYSVPQVKTTLRKKLCINHYATSCS